MCVVETLPLCTSQNYWYNHGNDSHQKATESGDRREPLQVPIALRGSDVTNEQQSRKARG